MRTGFIILLLAVVLLTGYDGWHLWRMTPWGWAGKLAVVGLFLLWMASAFCTFGFAERLPVRWATVLYEVGHPWMIAFLYLLVIFLVTDLATLCRILPKSFTHDSVAGFCTVFGLVAILLTAGHFHYLNKHREELTIRTDKPLERPLTIVLASDLHLGYHNRKPELERWIDMIQAENPDLVLLAGDIIDMRLRPVLEGNYAEAFQRLQAPVWAVPGNHDYYSHLEEAKDFFRKAGITLLQDTVLDFAGIRVVGRDDRTNPDRKALSALADTPEKFTLLLDHQPYHLEEAEASGVDFQFSGHTHRGQVWPLSWVTDALYEKSWGHHQRGSTRYYVSSGLGIWGPTIRIGTRSEFLVLHLSDK